MTESSSKIPQNSEMQPVCEEVQVSDEKRSWRDVVSWLVLILSTALLCFLIANTYFWMTLIFFLTEGNMLLNLLAFALALLLAILLARKLFRRTKRIVLKAAIVIDAIFFTALISLLLSFVVWLLGI